MCVCALPHCYVGFSRNFGRHLHFLRNNFFLARLNWRQKFLRHVAVCTAPVVGPLKSIYFNVSRLTSAQALKSCTLVHRVNSIPEIVASWWAVPVFRFGYCACLLHLKKFFFAFYVNSLSYWDSLWTISLCFVLITFYLLSHQAMFNHHRMIQVN